MVNLLNSFRKGKWSRQWALLETLAMRKKIPPELRYHDITPVAKPDNKRLASVLSPVSENGLQTEEETLKLINNAVHK